MITVNVLYFGAVREACKVAHEKISLESGTTVDGLVDQLQIDYPPLADFRKRVRMAVNESIAPASTILDDGDTVAFIPQVAGGSDVYCRLTDEPLSVDEVLNAISGPSQGGAVIFVGTVRNNNNGHEVTKLYYEAYPAMVHRTLMDIIEECERQADGVRVAVAHRTGELRIGDAAVVIGASAPHRAAAFDAARMCIERLKQDVPIWKKEFAPVLSGWPIGHERADGSGAAGAPQPRRLERAIRTRGFGARAVCPGALARRCPQSRRSGRSRSGVSQRSIGYRTGVGRPRPPGHRNRCVRCRAAAAGQRGRASRRGRSAQPRAGRLGLLGTRRDAFRAGAQQALLGCGDISPRL